MKKKVLDERQEQKLLHIEKNGFWLAFWGLLAAILYQLITNDEVGFEQVAGEWIVFMLMCLYMGFASLRHGIWDRYIKPSPKSNFIFSAIAGLVAGLFTGIQSFINYEALVGSILAGAFVFFSTLALCYFLLSLMTKAYHKRVDYLENHHDE